MNTCTQCGCHESIDLKDDMMAHVAEAVNLVGVCRHCALKRGFGILEESIKEAAKALGSIGTMEVFADAIVIHEQASQNAGQPIAISCDAIRAVAKMASIGCGVVMKELKCH